jgi:hypothetical protein
MSDRIYPIYHKGYKIYYTDWTGFKVESEALAAIKETSDFVVAQGEYELLEIIDVSNSISPPLVLSALMECAKTVQPYSKKKAIIGINGAKLFLLKAVNKFIDGKITGFVYKEDALDWLIE